MSNTSNGEEKTKDSKMEASHLDATVPRKIQQGTEFQAVIPLLLTKSLRKSVKEDPTRLGTVMWIPGKLPSRVVDHYLDFVDNVVGGKHSGDVNFSEERALYFLHRCEYDIEKARGLLSLKEAQVRDEKTDSDSEEASAFDEEDSCFVCHDGGSLLLCDVVGCRRVFHLHCADISEVPVGMWECPTHFCMTCRTRSEPSTRCSYCPNAYCKKHLPPSLVDKNNDCEFLCTDCNASNLSSKQRFISRLLSLMKRRNEPIVKFPRIAGSELDLFALYRGVTKLGGVKKVTESMSWVRVKEILQLPASATNASSILKAVYVKLLYPYEQLFFAGSVPLDNTPQKRVRPRGRKRKMRNVVLSDICDIVVTGSYPHHLTLEINVNGCIRHGFVFKPQALPPAKSGSRNNGRMPFSRSPRQIIPIFPARPMPHCETVVDVKLALKKMQMTQTQLGKEIGTPQEVISSFLTGKAVASRHELPRKLKGWVAGQNSSIRDYISNEKTKNDFDGNGEASRKPVAYAAPKSIDSGDEDDRSLIDDDSDRLENGHDHEMDSEDGSTTAGESDFVDSDVDMPPTESPTQQCKINDSSNIDEASSSRISRNENQVDRSVKRRRVEV